MTADLHTHTNASDANLSRRQLLDFARQCGVKQLAITDHDTIKNSYSAPDDGLAVIEGCELSAYDSIIDNHVHILCYMPKDKQPLEVYFEKMRRERERAGLIMLEKVNRLYPVVTEQSVGKYKAESGVIFKQAIMSVLVEYGYASQLIGPLFQQLFNRLDGTCHVPISYGEPGEVIALAREARGVVVHAHPSVYKNMPVAARFAAQRAVDGFEVAHPRNSEKDKTTLLSYCTENSLLITGGSDYHGATAAGTMPGMFYTDEANLEKLFEKAASL
jgi:Predicted metal-dependent phosphoesterases (PHP family)